jgi:hypothetical protein
MVPGDSLASVFQSVIKKKCSRRGKRQRGEAFASVLMNINNNNNTKQATSKPNKPPTTRCAIPMDTLASLGGAPVAKPVSPHNDNKLERPKRPKSSGRKSQKFQAKQRAPHKAGGRVSKHKQNYLTALTRDKSTGGLIQLSEPTKSNAAENPFDSISRTSNSKENAAVANRGMSRKRRSAIKLQNRVAKQLRKAANESKTARRGALTAVSTNAQNVGLGALYGIPLIMQRTNGSMKNSGSVPNSTSESPSARKVMKRLVSPPHSLLSKTLSVSAERIPTNRDLQPSSLHGMKTRSLEPPETPLLIDSTETDDISLEPQQGGTVREMSKVDGTGDQKDSWSTRNGDAEKTNIASSKSKRDGPAVPSKEAKQKSTRTRALQRTKKSAHKDSIWSRDSLPKRSQEHISTLEGRSGLDKQQETMSDERVPKSDTSESHSSLRSEERHIKNVEDDPSVRRPVGTNTSAKQLLRRSKRRLSLEQSYSSKEPLEATDAEDSSIGYGGVLAMVADSSEAKDKMNADQANLEISPKNGMKRRRSSAGHENLKWAFKGENGCYVTDLEVVDPNAFQGMKGGSEQTTAVQIKTESNQDETQSSPRDESNLRRSRRNFVLPDQFGAHADKKLGKEKLLGTTPLPCGNLKKNKTSAMARDSPVPSKSTKRPRTSEKEGSAYTESAAKAKPGENRRSSAISRDDSKQWTEREVVLLREAHKEIDPKSVSFWEEASEMVGAKSSEECREKWFSSVKTPVMPTRKIKKQQAPKFPAVYADDDIFNATPMKALFQTDSLDESALLFGGIGGLSNLDIGSAIKVGNASVSSSSHAPHHPQHGYKTYIKAMKRGVRIKKGIRPPRAGKPSKARKNLSERDGEGDFEVKGRLSPGGTLRVNAQSHRDTEDDDLDLNYVDEAEQDAC